MVHATISKTKSPKSGASAERQSIQVISRAAAVLRALERQPDGLSLGEIAAEVGLPRSTVQRIVDALDTENLVLASSSSRGVRLGPAVLRLAAATRFEIGALARETMEALARETGETVDLSVADNDKAVFVDQVAGTQRLLAVSVVGGAFPLHCSANGKAFLAAFPDAQIARLKKRLVLERHTKNTITTWPALEREIARVRETGVAFDREENSPGVCAAAVAFETPRGELAAISLEAPAERFLANEAALVRALVERCGELALKLTRATR